MGFGDYFDNQLFPDAENHILSKGCRRVFNGA
jgi:hypothetical protein